VADAVSNARTNTLAIRTPEGISFSLTLAGPMARFLAWLVDGVLVWVAVVSLQLAMTVWSLFEADVIPAIGLLATFVIWFGYGIATEWWWRGQTLGKRFLKLRVVDANGLRLRPSQIVIRNLLRVVDGLPVFYAVGGVVALCSRRHQRLGDLAANTVVVRIPTITEPDLSKIMAGKFNSFRDHPHLESRLRQRVHPQEASVAFQALMRRDDFEPSARVALFAALAGHFRRLVLFPQEITEGLTDEQYVRNVVDSIFRKQSGRTEPSLQPGTVEA
jgi:uncharacterized RDD family membrane protein YckC